MAMTSGTWIRSTFVLMMNHSQLVLGIFESTVNDIHGFHMCRIHHLARSLKLSMLTHLYLLGKQNNATLDIGNKPKGKCQFLNKSTLQERPTSRELDGKPAFMNDSSLETADGLLKVPRPALPACVLCNTQTVSGLYAFYLKE